MHIKNIIKSISAVAILAALPANVAAQDTQFGAGASVGTSGISIEGKYKLNDKFSLRGAYNFLELDQDEEYDDIDYDGTIEFSTFGGFADFHPFSNGFVLTGGALLGDKEFNLTASPTDDVEIGDTIYTAAQAGDLDSTISFGNFATFLGLGYDGFGYTESNLSMNVRAGVMIMDGPEAKLTSTNGVLSDNADFLAEIEVERAKLEAEIEDFRYYPIISAGLTYQF